MLIYEANVQRLKWNTLHYIILTSIQSKHTAKAFLKAYVIFQAFPRNRTNDFAVVWAAGIKHTSALTRGILGTFSPQVSTNIIMWKIWPEETQIQRCIRSVLHAAVKVEVECVISQHLHQQTDFNINNNYTLHLSHHKYK